MYCRVLVVDDDQNILNALRRELMRPPIVGTDGIEIEAFSRAEDALDRLVQEDSDFDVAIVDYHMPVMNGVTFLDRLRTLHPTTIRILLTGAITSYGAVAAINAARVDYLLTKPWHEYDLKGRIALALHQRDLIAQSNSNSTSLNTTPMADQTFRLLIVDDEPSLCKALVRELSMQGRLTRQPQPLFEIVTSSSAADALLKIQAEHYHFVLSDYAMPDMDGIELLYQVRELSPQSVRILMSGRTDLNVLVQAVNVAGIYHFIGKPWETTEVIALIAGALGYQRLLLK